MRLISFDVGIKHMAYCIFDVDTDISNQSFTIVDWKVLDLTPAKDQCKSLPTCSFHSKSSKPCRKPAKYEKNNMFCCLKHSNENLYWYPKKEFTVSALQKLKLHELIEWKDKIDGNKEDFPVRKPDIVKYLRKYFETKCWNTVESPTKTRTNDIDLISIGRSLHQQLSSNTYLQTITHVIIENQISPIATRMKTIQGMLAQHFISLGISNIEFVSSSNKLKNFLVNEQTPSTYKSNKKKGIVFCRNVLTTHSVESWLVYFENTKIKKDDLADCFLQGFWYLEKKVFKDAYNLKRNNVD